MSAAEFLGPLAEEGFVKAPPPRRPTTSTKATSEPTGPSPAAEWQSTEDQRAVNRAGFFSPIAWQLHCQGWIDEDEMKKGLAAGFVDGDSFRAHVAKSSAPSVFPPIRRDPTPALEDRRSPQFPFGVPSQKPALDLDDPAALLRLRISLGKGNRRAHLDVDQIQDDLRPLLVETSTDVDELERRQEQAGQYQAPLPWARGAKYWIIRRHRAAIDGTLIPRIPKQVNPCWHVGLQCLG